MTKDEWETTVTWIHTDDVVRIYTAHPKHLNRLRNDNRATLVRDYGDSADFTIPADQFDPLKGFKRRMSEEQRQAVAERLATYREN
jgi:hypothetical protein